MFDLSGPQPYSEDPPILVGSRVYQYYEDGTYDLGHVCEMAAGSVCVDFVDWKYRWQLVQLCYHYRDGRLALMPSCPGQEVTLYSRR